MSSFSTTQNTANDDGPQARWGAPPWATGRNGPPLPIKIAVVAVAFAIFKPLALVAAGYFLLRGRFNGKCSPCSRRGGPLSRTSGNSVFDDHKRETLDRLRDEEKAFADFEASKRKAEDKQAFDTFMAARNAPSEPTDDAPKS
jgi:Protein of unknown function (DUF2852)